MMVDPEGYHMENMNILAKTGGVARSDGDVCVTRSAQDAAT